VNPRLALRVGVAAATLGVAAVPSLPAQGTASIGVGAVDVRFTDQPAITAATVSPSLAWRSRQLSVALNGTVSRVGDAGWSQQGMLLASVYTPVSARGFALEGGGALGGSRFPDGLATAQRLGAARLHWLGDAFSMWTGAGAGQMFDGLAWRSLAQGEIGAVHATPLRTFTLVATPSVTADTLRYTDLLSVVSTSAGVLDVQASLGGRLGAELPIPGGDQAVWGGVTVTAWIAPRVALHAGAGTYPVDVTQGFPAGNYVSLGMRFGAPRPLRAVAAESARRVRREARVGGVHGFSLHRAPGGEIELRVQAPAAARVEVNGDPTGWTPVALSRDADGGWTVRLTYQGRVAELVLRVDGGAWMVPPGAEEVVDEFGGRSGRVVLP